MKFSISAVCAHKLAAENKALGGGFSGKAISKFMDQSLYSEEILLLLLLTISQVYAADRHWFIVTNL